ncbi:MAG: hypothetical protein ACRDD1_01325 [Planctomycetia bacterium]
MFAVYFVVVTLVASPPVDVRSEIEVLAAPTRVESDAAYRLPTPSGFFDDQPSEFTETDEEQRERLRVEAVMNRPVNFKMVKTPLPEFARRLGAAIGKPVLLDPEGLRIAEVADDAEVTLSAKGVPLHAAVDRILHLLDLTLIYRPEFLLVTHRQGHATDMHPRLYPVGDLIRDDLAYAEEFTDLVIASVASDTWDENGGEGSIVYDRRLRCLVVQQSKETHQYLEGFLAACRRVDRRLKAAGVDVRIPPAWDSNIKGPSSKRDRRRLIDPVLESMVAKQTADRAN